MAIFKTEKAKGKEIPPLLSPPLVEAIFELRWEMQGDAETGRLRDPAYPMMYGRMYERMKKEFPVVEDLPSTQVHPEASPYTVRHRMRKDKTSYPLVQVGPGIITVNHAKGYSWTDYKNLVARLIEMIRELYPVGSIPLNFVKAEVRYVNGILFDMQKEHPLHFLAEKLHAKVEIDPEIFALNDMSEKPFSVGLNLAYPLNKPVGNLAISMGQGQIDNKPAFILQTLIQSLGETVPQDKSGFDAWLNQAHEAACNCFIALCKGPLMHQFGQKS